MPIYVESTAPGIYPGDTPGRLLEGDRTAILGDVSFGVVNGDGVRVYLSRMDGWYGSPGSTGQVEQRAGDHGGWPGPAHLTPRVIQILARLRGSSWPHLDATIEAILGAVPLQTLAPLTITDHGVTRVVWVRQESGAEPIVNRHGAGAEVSIALVAPDPRKYATEITTQQTGLPQTTGGLSLPISLPLSIGATVSSGVLVATNDGNMATRPTLRVHGPSPAFSITHRGTGQTLTYHDSIPAGRFLELDFDKRRALMDGTASRVVTGSWFEYAPGDNEVALAASTYDPDALLVSEHRSAWR